jgi:hypothetical protein
MTNEEWAKIREEARYALVAKSPKTIDSMILEMRALKQEFPDGRIPGDRCPILTIEVFLDVCERIFRLEQIVSAVEAKYVTKLEG